jgi:hypothetical protein
MVEVVTALMATLVVAAVHGLVEEAQAWAHALYPFCKCELQSSKTRRTTHQLLASASSREGT